MLGRSIVLAFAAASLHACGGGPSSPSPARSATTTAPASTTLTVVSGETQQSISGARIVVGGEAFSTDDAGNASVGVLRLGANIDVLAEGFFDRQTLYRRSGETRLSLWPLTSPTGLTPEISQRLVYSGWGRDAVLGEVPLRRPPLGEIIQVLVEPEIASDPRVTRILDGSLAAMRGALQNQLTFVVTSQAPTQGVTWHVLIDPNAVDSEFVSITRWIFDDQELAGAELAFRTLPDLVNYERLLTHMMGTAFGLRDSSDVNDRMYFDWWSRGPNDFSPKEGLVMRLMLQRLAGNRWPDNDRSLGASRLAPEAVRYLRPRS